MSRILKDATTILHRKIIGNEESKIQSLKVERLNAAIAQQLYELRTSVGLSQRGLAEKIGTTASVICRLEDSDYEGHSLSMLRKIAGALGKEIKIEFLPDSSSQSGDEDSVYAAFPYRKLAEMELVKATRKKSEKIEQLRVFHQVSNLCEVGLPSGVHGRIGRGGVFSPISLASWLRAGELLADNISVETRSDRLSIDQLSSLRSLCGDSQGVLEKLRDLCASVGLAFVLVPYFPKSRVNGALRRIDADKVLIQVSDRYKWSDVFWFSFFHEVAHLQLHDYEGDFIDLEGQQRTELEEEADNWAAELLIPSDRYSDFINSYRITRANIVDFASELNVSPGIAVGRLQHDKALNKNQYNSLRRKLDAVL